MDLVLARPTYRFSPLHVSGCVLWLRSSRITGHADNDLVATWADLSGAGSDATAAGAARPTYKTGILNGRPAIRFGGGQYLSTACVPATGTGPRTLIAVVTNVVQSADAYQHILHYGSGNVTGATYGICHRVGGSNVFGNHYWGSGSNSGVVPATSTPYIVILQFDGTTDRWWVNGTAGTPNNPTINTGSATGLQIGTRVGPVEYGRFDALEVIAYNRAISTPEINRFLRYASLEYATAVAYL